MNLVYHKKRTIERKKRSYVLEKINNYPEDKKSMTIFLEFEKNIEDIDNITKPLTLAIDSNKKKMFVIDLEIKKLKKKYEKLEKSLSKKKKKEVKVGKNKMKILIEYDKFLQEKEKINEQKIVCCQKTFENNIFVKGIIELGKLLPLFQKNRNNIETILHIVKTKKLDVKKINDVLDKYNKDMSYLESTLEIIKKKRADIETTNYKLNKKLHLLCQICNNNFASDMLHNFCNCLSGNQCIECWWKLLEEREKCVYCCKKISFANMNKASYDSFSLLKNSSIFIKDQKIAQEFKDNKTFFGKVTLVDKDKILVTFNDNDIREYTHKEAQNKLIVLS